MKPPFGDTLTDDRDIDRFVARVEVLPSGCWEWQGTRVRGYGMFHVLRDGAKRSIGAHRVSWSTFVGPIPDGLVIDHLCRNRACVNPDHMEPVTNKENILRGQGMGAINARKTHCPRGHPYDDANTVRWAGERACATCRRLNR